jgi:hypothetical protein
MIGRLLGASTAALVCFLGSSAFGQETPQAVVQRAIQAHGGQELLARAGAEVVKLRGALYLGASAVPFVNETTVQLPSRFRSVVQMKVGNRTQTVVHVLDGDRAEATLDGQPQPLTEHHVAQLRQTLQLERALRLVPLLDERAFTLVALGEAQVNGRSAVGVCVRGGAHRELKLWFDRQTALLVKTEQLLDGPGGKEIRQEAFYADYRPLGGRLRPGKVAGYRDGRKLMEAEVVEAQAFGPIASPAAPGQPSPRQ